jgi:2-amino-4-hydroxy-6-hydroxymethyldihydropteridine diphosphokinase
MKTVFLGLGGNIGDVAHTLSQAKKEIQALSFVHNFKHSKLYRTSPVSDIKQESYLNCILSFETEVNPLEALYAFQKLEVALGKKQKAKNAPRVIDIDIIVFGQELISNVELEVPHPRFRERLFVLVPLLDLTKIVYLSTQNSTILICLDIQNEIAKLQQTTCDIVEIVQHPEFD